MSNTKPLRNTMRKSPMKQVAVGDTGVTLAPKAKPAPKTETYGGSKVPTVEVKKKAGERVPAKTSYTKAEALVKAKAGKKGQSFANKSTKPKAKV
jgi:hypothetical protein